MGSVQLQLPDYGVKPCVALGESHLGGNRSEQACVIVLVREVLDDLAASVSRGNDERSLQSGEVERFRRRCERYAVLARGI